MSQSSMNPASLLAILVALVLSFAGGVYFEKGRTKAAVSDAVAKAAKENADRNEEVVNGWAHAVDYLRARIRNGDAPRIPLPGTPGTGTSAGASAGTAAPGVSLAGELETCRAERKQLIEDGARTMINCKALQQWAK